MDRISMRRMGRWVLLGGLVVVALGALSVPAFAGGHARRHRGHAVHSRISIAGPTSVKLGSPFRFRITGFLAAPATKVAIFEDSRSCSSKQLDELNRRSSVEPDQFLPSRGHHFTRNLSLFARVLGKHYLCAYVFNKGVPSHRTYARAQHVWSNHR